MFVYISSSLHQQVTDTVVKTKLCIHAEFSISYCKDNIKRDTVNREIFVMVLFWPILAPKYEVPKLNTPKYVTLQKLTAKIEHCLNIFLYLYCLVCTFLSYFFPK